MRIKNVNDANAKTDERRIVTSCGVAAIMPSKKEEDAVNRYLVKVRNQLGGDLFDVVTHPEFAVLPLHSDKDYGPYLGDQKTTEFMWINLFHYMFWKNNATKIESMVQNFISQYPSAQENIADVYRWARETFINEELAKRGRQPMYQAIPPKFDPYANIAINAEAFCAYTSNVMGNMISVMAQNGACVEYVGQTIEQLTKEITNILQYYSDNIRQQVMQRHQEAQMQRGNVSNVIQYAAYSQPEQIAPDMNHETVDFVRQDMVRKYAAHQTNLVQQKAFEMQQQGIPVEQIDQFVGEQMQNINNQIVAFTAPSQQAPTEDRVVDNYVPEMSNPEEPKEVIPDISAAVQSEKDFVTDIDNIANVDFYPIDKPDIGHPNPAHVVTQGPQNIYGSQIGGYGAMGNNPFASSSDYTGNF